MRDLGRIARALAVVCVAGGMLGLVGPAAHASDDYPWAGQGQCPVETQEPIAEPPPTPTPPPGPMPPKAGASGQPVVAPPPPPPVLDPVSGHLYDPRGPKPVCTSRVWSIGGSIGDAWGFVLRNCTSFVAWRLQERNQMTGFANDFGGEHWGNAENWDDAARQLGYRVDSTPAIGAVAQSDSGRVGHVAWVSSIGPGTVTVEEYNHATPGGYGTRTVPVGDFRYLHLGDLAPSPLIGSDRAVVSVPDGLGESWTARVDDRGTLWLARPGRPAGVVGARGAFSALVAPALVLDRQGRPWVAATTRTGRVLGGTMRGNRLALRDLGASAPTASPALARTRAQRPVLAATSTAGTLVIRRHTESGHWSRPARVGETGSWATHTAPVLGVDGAGRTLLVAVSASGSTFAQTLKKGRLIRLSAGGASLTSTPALSLSADDTAHLHQVAADGRLRVWNLVDRRWSRPRAIDGDWSPYASPVIGAVAGQLHVAAVARHGALLVRAAVPGEMSQLPGTIRTSGDPTRSPGLVTRGDSGLFVVVTRGRRTHARLLTRPAWAVTGLTSPTRAGFTP